MTLIRLLITLIFIIYPYFSIAGGEKKVDWQDRVLLPVPEIAYKVDKWMRSFGVLVEQSPLKNGGIRIVGSGGEKSENEKWLVELIPQSSLGTEVSIQLEGNGGAVQERINLLAELLQPREDGEGTYIDSESNAIPEPILSQIGNVACIHAQTSSKTLQFTGFFIDDEGLILCTAHDLLKHEQVKIMSNTGVFYEGDVITADFEKDLALIKVNATKEGIVNVTDGRNLLGMGETVFLIGCPINLRGTIQRGFVNGPPRKANNVPLWQVQMKIQPGSSGSPVFDSTGAFVAVVKGRHREAKDIGFLIPLEVVVEFLKDYFSS